MLVFSATDTLAADVKDGGPLGTDGVGVGVGTGVGVGVGELSPPQPVSKARAMREGAVYRMAFLYADKSSNNR